MNVRRIIIVLIIALIPAFVQAEMLVLKDGSSLQGKVVRFEGDTLTFKTSFGSDIKVPRDKIARIVFSDSAVHMGGVQAPVQLVAPGAPGTPGTLVLDFSNTEVSSTILIHRGRDKEAHLNANVIFAKLRIDGIEAYSWSDSSTDKTIKEGPDTEYRNKARLEDIAMELPPGSYRLDLFVGNYEVDDYHDAFKNGPLDQTVTIYDVTIKPGAETRYDIRMKKKVLGLAGRNLAVSD